MDRLNEKLDLITDIWNDYILELEHFQTEINFTEQKDSNFYGDIMHFFYDTFSILSKHDEKIKEKSSFDESIVYLIGLLQTIYVHQDLMHELLRIFKLKESNCNEKRKIRYLRNELIGHPICRDRCKKLQSSVFWGKDLSYDCIHYIKYPQGKYLNSNEVRLNVSDLIKSHKSYLSENFTKILYKERILIKTYNKKLIKIKELLTQEDKLEILINTSYKCIDYIASNSIYFSEGYTLKAYENLNNGIRYRTYIKCFCNEVRQSVEELLSSTEEHIDRIDMLNEKVKDILLNKEISYEIDDSEIDIDIVFGKDNNEEYISNKTMNIYYISKLSEKKNLEHIDTLIQMYSNEEELIKELYNMKNSVYNNNDFEYYCSYLYIKEKLTENC